MVDFSGHSEKFHVSLADDSSREDVMLELSMEGLKVMNPAGSMTKRKYPLEHITRWSRATDRLTMFVKTPVDIEEKAITLYGPHHVLSSLLDTLTSFCLQLVEIMEARESAEAREAAQELRAVAKNGGRRHRQLKNADEVEFWSKPDKAGYMHSQGEIVKSWRKRWFVLKDGFLFRFLNADVTPTSKPRGIVDLSKIGDVTCGKPVTGRANSIKLGTQKGYVAYLTESETEMVEWISALESTVSRLVRMIAGVDDDEPRATTSTPAHSVSNNAKLLQQLEQTFRSSGATGGSGNQPAPARPQHHYAGSANYPSVGALPGMPKMPSFPASRASAHTSMGGQGGRSFSSSQQAGSVCHDELGVQYGMGTGLSMGGIAGIGGVRHNTESSLPATINVVGAAPASQHMQQPSSYNHPTSYSSSYSSYESVPEPQLYSSPPVSLPDTITVTSIIDQMPTQQPVYGMYGQTGGYSSPAVPVAPPMPQADHSQWETHYSDGRPYYFNRSTGQTQWEAPH